jgi:pilus assembly protein CpaF
MRGGISILVSGPAGAGKSTLMLALLNAVNPDERILSLEDVPELDLDGLPEAVQQYTGEANLEGVGRRRVRELLRDIVQMYPDRLVLGECKGPEALDLLVAAGTGSVFLMSIHSRTPQGALAQLATFAQMAEERIERAPILELIALNLQLVIQCSFVPGLRPRKRRISHIYEVTGIGEHGSIRGQDLWVIDPSTNQLSWTGIRPRCLEQLDEYGVSYRLPSPPLDAARLLLGRNGHVGLPV